MKLSLCGLTAIAAVAIAGCGDSTSSSPASAAPSSPPTASGGQPGVPAILNLQNATVAPPVASDTTVPLNPLLYTDPGNPCAGVTDTVTVPKVDPSCGIAFVRLNSEVVPARTLTTQYSFSADPPTAFVQQGISAADGTAVGNAFHASNAIRAWAVNYPASGIIPVLDGYGQAADPLNQALTAKKVASVNIPTCVFPSSMRVVKAGPDVLTYLESVGWPGPSGTAVVATFEVCAGMTVTFTDNSTIQLLGHTKPVSIVTTGVVASTPPFGPIWIQNGWAPCGPSQLRSICG